MTESEIDVLLARAAAGDARAPGELLEGHRTRLRSMVAVRLDPRLAARLDPSDLVQDALLDAHRQLSQYLEHRPLPFYPWLRQVTWQRLVLAHRQHLRVAARSAAREVAGDWALSDASVDHLAERFVASGTNPPSRAIRSELRGRVREALTELSPQDRDVLVLRFLEQLSTSETAAVLGASDSAVKMRQLRALARLREVLDHE
ncbi:MAG: sigma-70 family RNA polymerase sigma factor [Pirellulaceae bacterium]